MRIAIQGIGISGGFGVGISKMREALQTATVTPQTATVERNNHETDCFPLYRATTDGLDEFFPKRALRRIDHFSKLTLLSACLALKDADLYETERSGTGVVIASGYGALQTTFDFLDSYLDFGYSCSSPTHFSNSVHNAAAAHVSMQLKATAPSLTVTQFEMSVGSAMLTAQQWLAEGRVERVLFGCIDEYCDVLRYCRKQVFSDGEQGPIAPFDYARQTAVPGEGAVFFVLTRADGSSPYASIDTVTLGNHLANPLRVAADTTLVVGADGHKECGRLYQQICKQQTAWSYTPVYGSFPAAAGFDLAAAAVCLADKQLYPTPGAASQQKPLADSAELACLKFGPGGDYSLIRMTR